MFRETYIPNYIRRRFADHSDAQQLAIMGELWAFFDALKVEHSIGERFDSLTSDMVESDSRKGLLPLPPI
jgi:hypothetical protein